MPAKPTPADAFPLLHIEDDAFWGEHVAKLIGGWPEFRLVGTAATGATGIAHFQQLEPELVLLDLRLPDMDGFAVLEKLCATRVPPRVLLLSCRKDDVTLHHLSSPHVSGMLLKSPGFDHMLRSALTIVAAGGRFFTPEVQADLRRFRSASDAFHKTISPREQAVLRQIALGCSDAEIAAILGISHATAHSHRQNLMDKVNIHCSRKLMRWAQEKGFA